MSKAEKEFECSLYYEDGHILRIRIRLVPEPVPPPGYGFKYSCFYDRPGERVVLYDNERAKGAIGTIANGKSRTGFEGSRR